MFTDFYDCPDMYRRELQGGPIEIKNVCLNILTSTSPSWLLPVLKEAGLGGGFWARWIIVPAYEKDREYSMPQKADPSKRDEIVSKLAKISNCERAECDISEVKEIYDCWWSAHKSELAEADVNPYISGSFTRLEAMIWKIAMVIQSTRNQTSLIEPQSLHEAIKIVEWLKREYKKLSTEVFIVGKFQQNKEKIKDILRKKGGRLDHSTLLRLSHLEADKELWPVLNTLSQSKEVKKEGKEWVLISD